MKSGLVALSLLVFSPMWIPYASLVPLHNSGNPNWDSYVGKAGSTYDAQKNPAQASGTVSYNPLAPLASVAPSPAQRQRQQQSLMAENRRQFLRCGLTGALTVFAAAAARPARAQDFPKADQASASYQDNAADHTCAECSLFLPPDQCKVVQGPVSEHGTCIYFNQ